MVSTFSINYSQQFCQSPREREKLSDPLFSLLSTGHCLTINGTSCLTLPKRFKSTELFTLPSQLRFILDSLRGPNVLVTWSSEEGGGGREEMGQEAVSPGFRFRWLHKSLVSFFAAPFTFFCQLFLLLPTKWQEFVRKQSVLFGSRLAALTWLTWPTCPSYCSPIPSAWTFLFALAWMSKSA